jgi:hypothetical protein
MTALTFCDDITLVPMYNKLSGVSVNPVSRDAPVVVKSKRMQA